MTDKLKNAAHAMYVESLKEAALKEAEQIVLQFPIMNVNGTPFDCGPAVSTPNQGDDEEIGSGTLGADLTMTPAKKAINSSASQLKYEATIKRGVPMKTASMWAVLATSAVFYKAMTAKFRYERLRRKLEQHLLPHLLNRRVRMTLGTTANAAASVQHAERASAVIPEGTLPESEKPNGSYLMRYCPMIGALQDITFADDVARGLMKLNKMVGDDVVRCDEGSQNLLLVITSGRYEWVQPTTSALSSPTPDGRPNSPTIISLNSPVNQRVSAPIVCGDVFGGPSRYRKTLYARSKGVVWYISRLNFETIFETAPLRVRERFKELKRKEMQDSLVENFPLLLGRIPLLRRMDRELVKTYFPQFEPTVLDKDTLLFEEGSGGAAVYLICDGSVLRTRKGTAEDPAGASQQLSVGTNGKLFGGRYAFVGEEIFILPEKYRYTCTVSSEYVRAYKISANVFTSILLDDPKLLLKLREGSLVQRAKMMKLKVDSLRQVPLLQDFPPARLTTLFQFMMPRVVERSTILCQSQQPLKEIYFVVRGEVRDARNPTVAPPILNQVKPLAQVNVNNTPAPTSPQLTSPASPLPSASQTQPVERLQSFARSLSKVGGGLLARVGSSVGSTVSNNANANEVYVQEDEDSTPLLPVGFAPGILHALGGNWEGLLSDKWSCAWETTSVTELWVLPTAAIRSEYNALHRSLQSSILHQVRINQMKDLELDAIPMTKLPPMSVFRDSNMIDLGGGGGTSGDDNGGSIGPRHSIALTGARTVKPKKSLKLSVDSGIKAESVTSSEDEHDDAPAVPKKKIPQPPKKPSSNEKKSPQTPLSPASKKSDRGKKQTAKGANGPPSPTSLADHIDPGFAEEMANMRKLAQERNERAQLMRSIPIEEAIRRETKRLNAGQHKSASGILPPLLSREDKLYFHYDDEMTGDEANKPLRSLGGSPTGTSPPGTPLRRSPVQHAPSTAEGNQRKGRAVRPVALTPRGTGKEPSLGGTLPRIGLQTPSRGLSSSSRWPHKSPVRWFEHVPEIAAVPEKQYPTEAFDILLVKTLKSKEATELLRPKLQASQI